MSFFTGFGVSALVYIVLNKLFPVPGISTEFEEVDIGEFDDDTGSIGSDVVRDVTDLRDDDMKKENI